MREITYRVYSFDELSDEAKQSAIEWVKNDNGYAFDFAAESIVDTAKQAGDIIGIDINDMAYDVSPTQGRGASFTGTYAYKKNSVKNIKTEFPGDTKLHGIAENLANIQRKYFYGLNAKISRHNSRYCHPNTVSIEVDHDNNIDLPNGAIDFIEETLRDFMHWIFSMLEQEYHYIYIGDEYAIETIWLNGYEFLEDGSIA